MVSSQVDDDDDDDDDDDGGSKHAVLMITNKTSSQLRAPSGAEEVAAWKETVPKFTAPSCVVGGYSFGFILVDFSPSHLNKNHEKRA